MMWLVAIRVKFHGYIAARRGYPTPAPNRVTVRMLKLNMIGPPFTSNPKRNRRDTKYQRHSGQHAEEASNHFTDCNTVSQLGCEMASSVVYSWKFGGKNTMQVALSAETQA